MKSQVYNMEKCQGCENLDKAQSNKIWVVCPYIPIKVILEGSSENCSEYNEKAIEPKELIGVDGKIIFDKQ